MGRQVEKNYHNRLAIISLLFFVPIFLSNCAILEQKSIDKHIKEIESEESLYAKNESHPADGSLWPGNGTRENLFLDDKASQLGDIVTIIVSENASASKTATTDTNSDSQVSADLSALFGFEKAIALKNKNFNPAAVLDSTYKNKSKGSGTTSRSGTLDAKIPAKVIKVFPNGSLLIKGRKEVTVNEEEQILILTGIIRPQDISSTNTISSSLIADAKITYTGQGVIADRQHPGFVSRILAWVWPF